ncbi:hypothetical protein GE118_04170 [Mycoplasma sp. NEAQ87857]|uniref:Mbov_0398 family ICE element protein n=1 Tax=Mycoplasma sp. NEAQ87857 TaxID=2683967 RepID=UPI001318E35B|nr:hypothetical protein [Mycoplasma sp. NEAQ87857]QGZ97972.1 hypothetical protein GE118_04170 [Mycoplasma sp. NEAQ87857]
MDKKLNNLTVRFNGLDDDEVNLIAKWMQKIKSEKQTLASKEIVNVLLDKLKSEELERNVSNFQQEIFYAFRKAMWASLTPFLKTIRSDFENRDIELVIINKKLDFMMEALKINPEHKVSENQNFKNLRNYLVNAKNEKMKLDMKQVNNVLDYFDDYMKALLKNIAKYNDYDIKKELKKEMDESKDKDNKNELDIEKFML